MIGGRFRSQDWVHSGLLDEGPLVKLLQLVWCCWSQESPVTICRSTSANVIMLLVFCMFFCVHGESLVSSLLLYIFISLVKARKVCIILAITFIWIFFFLQVLRKKCKKKILPHICMLQKILYLKLLTNISRERKVKLKEFVTVTPCNFMGLLLMVLVTSFSLL